MRFPSKCPYCGKDIVEHCESETHDHHGNCIEIHKCIHCSKPIFVINKTSYLNGTIQCNVIHYYPTVTTVDFPKRIKELSPNAYNAYEQSIKSKDQGFDMLVGAGLRIALEWLVWDYLIKIQNFSDTELEKLTLKKRLEKMDGNFYTKVCSKLIRLFGNDSVHIIKQLDFSIDEVIDAFDLLCKLIDSELQIYEVNERLDNK